MISLITGAVCTGSSGFSATVWPVFRFSAKSATLTIEASVMDGRLRNRQALRSGELENQLEPKLDDPFITVAGDLAIRATRIRNTYCVEVGVIEGIEGFSPELQV